MTVPVGDWTTVIHNSTLSATGATLGIMAIVLVIFLIMLCLPWSRCRRCKRCYEPPETPPRGPENWRDISSLEAYTGGYPITLLDLFPPSMLPKLPNYQECLDSGEPPAAEEVFPSPSDPTSLTHTPSPSRTPLPPVPHLRSDEHHRNIIITRPRSHSFSEPHRFSENWDNRTEHSESLPSSPPPMYTSVYSPTPSGLWSSRNASHRSRDSRIRRPLND